MTSENPSPDQWRRWQVDVVGELHGGKQSRVFDAMVDGRRAAVKLTESRLANRATLTSRLEAVEALGSGHPEVVAPIRIDGALVQPIGEWFMTATPFIEGDQLDVNVSSDAELLGGTLARLHRELGRLDSFEIPPVAALDSTEHLGQRSSWQLLHGDFSNKNVIATPTGLRIFDFDDSGYGPIEYDVANSLYMVLFDADVTNRPELYEAFRPAFLTGYASVQERRIADVDVDEMIAIRIDVLGRWLGDLSNAPIGIRTSTPAWLDTLASFVRSRGSTRGR